MKNCINCDHALELSAKFCHECGSKQPELPLEIKSQLIQQV
jgi:rRNA maturation endonuclease Nob1